MPVFMKTFNDKILKGIKTQTRRLLHDISKPHYIMKVGGVYACRNSRYKKEYFCKIGCTRRYVQRLREISLTDCIKEGFNGYDDFINGFLEINSHRLEPHETDPLVVVYEFVVILIPSVTDIAFIIDKPTKDFDNYVSNYMSEAQKKKFLQYTYLGSEFNVLNITIPHFDHDPYRDMQN